MTDRITEFRLYIEKHPGLERDAAERLEREEFLKEYPLSRIQELSVDEYCLGTERSKDSFCYLIEFGKYKHTGFGIGGGSAQKYGVYYNKSEQCYKHGNEPIDNIEEFWPQFRDAICRFCLIPKKRTSL